MNARRITYPGSGQNARGAGRRFRNEQVKLTRPYWAAWLAAVFKDYPTLTASALVRALAERPNDRDSHPRALFRSWQQQQGTVSPSNAARVGETLRSLGVTWSCAAVGLYAARHYAEFLVEIRRLASTVDVEYACGAFVYSQVLADFDIFGGFPFAVQIAGSVQIIREEARRKWEIVAGLPQVVSRIRCQLARAHDTVGSPSYQKYLHIANERPESKNALTRSLEPALQLLQSSAPPEIAWQAVLPLLDFWLHESIPPASEHSTATDLLWGASRVVASYTNGTKISGSIVFDDRDILKAIPMALTTEMTRGSLEATLRERVLIVNRSADVSSPKRRRGRKVTPAQ